MLSFEQMKELLEMVSRLGLGGAEVRSGDFSFRVSGGVEPATPKAAEPPVEPAPKRPAPPAAVPEPTPSAAPRETSTGDVQGYILTSPIVGTFYRAPSPEAEAYVSSGDRVEKGQVLCIVEAMKLMNEIECDVSGVVLAVLPENSQPVEFGEPLFSIKTD